jgi:Tfp pilus assembly protein FimT
MTRSFAGRVFTLVLNRKPEAERMKIGPASSRLEAAFTFAELMAAVVIVAMLLLLAQLSLLSRLGKSTFRAQVNQLISTLQMAASAAGESKSRYEVIIDLTEQKYMLREITSSDLSEVFEEDIIAENELSANCFVAYIEFDDEDWTNEGIAKFRAGHSGWQYGGKIVLLDQAETAYSIVVNRRNRIVTLKEGDVQLLKTRTEDEISL